MKDLIIIGASAAGISAGIYAARRKLDFKIIATDIGGEVATSGEIMNYPGFVKTDGLELSDKFKKHIDSYKPDMETDVRVEKVEKDNNHFVIKGKKTGKPVEYVAKTVILATGVRPRGLDIPGEKEFRGKGVTYCTVCDGPLFARKTVATVGGGNSALESALMLSKIAKEVNLLTINSEMKGEEVLIEKVKEASNINIIPNAFATKVSGEVFVKKLEYTNKEKTENHSLDVDGIFVHIGNIPNSTMVDVEKNNFGEVVTNKLGETSVPGLFAAGDVTDILYKQIAISTGQGVIAALTAINYLNTLSD